MARKLHRPTPTMQHCLEPANRQCFGLDIIALVGSLRYVKHQSIPEIHKQLFRCEGSLFIRLKPYSSGSYKAI
ncbi:MAG: hypothetical protein ACJ795_03750 [Ktedonobacteraceae bacterium]